jgi:hypothetical protein
MFTTDPDAVIRISHDNLNLDAKEYMELFLAQNLDFGHVDEIITMNERDLRALVTKALIAGMAFQKEVWSS